MRRVAVALVSASLVANGAACAPAADRVDAYARQAAQTWSVPDLQVAVVRDGRVLHVGATGDGGRLRAGDDPMPIASVTKQFTAAAIVALAQKNALSLDDAIASYVRVPQEWNQVTIYQLLTNTSGIPSYDRAEGFRAQIAQGVKPQRLLRFAETLGAEFPAGTAWHYSNTNYVLLGMVIEKVSGESYAGHLRRTIFEPLGMRGTAPCAGRARGFHMIARRREIAPPIDPSQMWAAGGICSTARDLALWAAALDGGRVVDAEHVRVMESPAHLHDGKTVATYGIANELAVLNGHHVAGHDGGLLGFGAVLLRLPDDHVSVVVLADQRNTPVAAIARHVAAMYVPTLETTASMHDANPARTAMLRGVVVSASRGEVDEKLFGYEEAMMLATAIHTHGPSSLGPLGALKSFVLLAAPTPAEPRYLATYERGEVEWQFALDRNGLIMDAEPTLR